MTGAEAGASVPADTEPEPLQLRPTRAQLLAVVLVSAVAGLLAAAVIGVLAAGVAGHVPWAVVAGAVLVLAVAVPAGTLLGGRNGIDADDVGIRPVSVGSTSGQYATWRRITEIRAERKLGRRRLVLLLDSGALWWLRVPYDGRWLAHDPDFDAKLDDLLARWRRYRA